MTEVEGTAVLTGTAPEIEDQWEFDAPRFRDFEQGTPPGESADDWFHTSATRGLATPIGRKPNTKGVAVTNEEYLEMSSQMNTENQSQQPQSQKTNVSSQPDPVEAEQVRAVLAHITNNTAPKQPVAGGTLVKKAPPKVETKPSGKASGAKKTSQPESHNKQQQAVPVPVKLKAATAGPAAEKKTVLPPAAPVVAPTSSRPATRAMEKTTNRTTRHTAVASTSTRAPPRVRAPITKVVAPVKKQPQQKQQQQRSKPQITVAKSPFLRSKQRSVTSRQTTKTTEEMELEKVEQAKKEAAALRRRNARTVGPALQGRSLAATASRPVPKRAPTEPTKEFNLRTAKRQRVHGMETRHQNNTGNAVSTAAPSPWKSNAQRVAEFTTGVATRQTQRRPAPRGARQQQQQQRGRAELTVPRTPRFATKTRARAPRFKPTEEEEAEKAAAEAHALKLRQKKASEMNRNPVIPAQQPRRSERRALTEFKPFSFATDVRAAYRSTQPAAELPPPPFTFGAQDNGPVTRSRAHVITTSAFASGAQQQQQQDEEYNEYGNVEDYDHQQQRLNSGGSGMATFKVGVSTRRRTTAGPMLLGGAVRVLRNEQQQQQQRQQEESGEHEQGGVHGRNMGENSDDECCTEEQDGMQAIIRAGATAGIDSRTTLHNPLFRA